MAGPLTGPLLVGAPTDGVLGRVRDELERRGQAAAVLTPSAYAQRISVAISGRTARVEPDVPLLLRSRDEADAAGADAVAEALALAGALSASPVVNRPALGLPAAPSSREAIDCLMSSGRMRPPLLLAERRSGGGPVDHAAFEQEPLPGPDGGGHGAAVRFRERMPPGWVYQKVLVVGDQCWLYHETVAAAPEIRRLSLETAAAAGLAFCCLYWRALLLGPGTGGLPVRLALARVSAQPTEAELADMADTAVSAVADLLLA